MLRTSSLKSSIASLTWLARLARGAAGLNPHFLYHTIQCFRIICREPGTLMSILKPIPRSLPSIESLRCFFAAAQHLNFRRAASEVGLTATAFSERIRGLERELGCALFARTTRR